MFGYSFIFRSVATAILMVVVFFALLGFLLTDNLRVNFLSAKFYNANLAENDVYNRFYSEVLVDPEFDDTADELIGNVDIPREDIAGVAREIMPADYLQDQVEGAVTGTIAYLNKEADTPQAFIELGPPLANVKPVLFSYMDQRIDKLEEVPVSTLEELEAKLEDLYRTLEMGEIPTQVPSLTRASAQEFAIQSHDNAYEAIKDAGLSQEALGGLDEQGDVIRGLLREGKVKESLKVSARGLAGPLIDEALDALRGELDDRERLDLIAIAAEHSNQDKGQFLEGLDDFREVINRGEMVVWISMIVLVLGILLLMIVHIPHVASSLRWPGITLLLSGLAILIVSLASQSGLEGQFNGLLDQVNVSASPIPTSITNIAGDVLASMAADLVGGLILPSIVIMVVGLAMLVTSFLIRSLRFPFLSR